MLQPSPEYQKRLIAHDLDYGLNALENKVHKSELRRMALKKLAAGTLAATAVLGVPVAYYTADVRANQAKQDNAHIYVSEQTEALDPINNDNALIFLDGVRTQSGIGLSNEIGKAFQTVIDGRLAPLVYNDAKISNKAAAEEVIEYAEDNNIRSVSFIARSGGGNTAMNVQEIVRETSDIEVEAIVLITTPTGIERLRPARQEEINLVESVSWIPGIAHSTAFHYITEMAMRSGTYDDGDIVERTEDFIATSNTVTKGIESNELTNTWVTLDQLFAIKNSNVQARIDNIGEQPDDKLVPTIVYFGTAEPGKDQVVDDTNSALDIAASAEENGVPFFGYKIKGAVHSMISKSKKAYIKTIAGSKEAIQASILAQHYIAAKNKAQNFVSVLDPEPSTSPVEALKIPSVDLRSLDHPPEEK